MKPGKILNKLNSYKNRTVTWDELFNIAEMFATFVNTDEESKTYKITISIERKDPADQQYKEEWEKKFAELGK